MMSGNVCNFSGSAFKIWEKRALFVSKKFSRVFRTSSSTSHTAILIVSCDIFRLYLLVTCDNRFIQDLKISSQVLNTTTRSSWNHTSASWAAVAAPLLRDCSHASFSKPGSLWYGMSSIRDCQIRDMWICKLFKNRRWSFGPVWKP